MDEVNGENSAHPANATCSLHSSKEANVSKLQQGHVATSPFFFPPQSNRFRSRDGTAVVFQKMFMPFGHHPVIPDGLCYKLTHLEELPWIHFIWVILCYKTLSIEKCVGMKKLKGDSNDFSGK